MWSSSTLKPAPPFIWGARLGLGFWVTSATLAATADSSTARPPLFADSGFQGPLRSGGPPGGRGPSGQPVPQRPVHLGVVEQSEVVGAADVQHVGTREELVAPA